MSSSLFTIDLTSLFRSLSRTLIGICFCFLSSQPLHAQHASNMSPEETSVRTAYARLSFGTEMATIRDLALANATPAAVTEGIAKNVVHFDIVSVKIGDIGEILNDTYGDLVTFPDTTTLETGYSGFNNSSSGVETSEGGTFARWATAQPLTFSTSVPLSMVLATVHVQGVKRYAKVAVTATLNTESRSYNGLWLFLDGAKEPVIIDPSSGAAIMTISSRSVYPHVLLETKLRFNPVVQAWLSSKTMNTPSCAATGQSECCDSSRMQCGISRKDIEQSLQKATDSRRMSAGQALSSVDVPSSYGGTLHAADDTPTNPKTTDCSTWNTGLLPDKDGLRQRASDNQNAQFGRPRTVVGRSRVL